MLDSCDRRGDEADRYEASKRRSAVRRTTKVSGRWRRPSWSRNRTVACGPATGRVREPQSATARCGTAGLARGLGAWKTCATRRRMRWIEAIRRCERQRQRSPHDGLRPIVDIAIDQLVARYRSATCFRIQAMNARFREAQPACGTPATDQKRPPRRLRQFADKFLKAPTRWVVVIRKKLGQFFSLRTYSKISGICQQAKGKT